MKRKWIYIVTGVAAWMAAACTKYPTDVRKGIPSEYTEGWLEIYGQCYDSINQGVVALDLYSDGLTLDENHRMKGTGYNLYISDIFVEDSQLVCGTYLSDTTAERFTFLPGKAFDDIPTGMYLLYVADNQLLSIQLLDSGTIVVSDTTDNLKDMRMTFYFRNVYGNTATYETHYQGALIPWQKRPRK